MPLLKYISVSGSGLSSFYAFVDWIIAVFLPADLPIHERLKQPPSAKFATGMLRQYYLHFQMSTTIDFGIDLGTTNSLIARFAAGADTECSQNLPPAQKVILRKEPEEEVS